MSKCAFAQWPKFTTVAIKASEVTLIIVVRRTHRFAGRPGS